MKQPSIQLIPLKGAIANDATTTVDLIIRIMPSQQEISLKRPKLNLGLVIDRSGSMSGKSIEYARKAAIYAVQQLLPTDRVSVVIYDDHVKTIVPNTLAENKSRIISKIEQIQPGGSTALHDGWVEGGVQVSQQLHTDQLNRVILLSDGLANVGQTNPDIIATDVHGLAKHGVSTTAMGIGDHYNEDLMEAMAKSGDGNYYYIKSPEQLPQIFNTELLGIMATMGQRVSLGIEPKENVVVSDVLNDLEKTKYGRYKLPNMIVGNPIDVVVRLKVPALASHISLCDFRLAWDNPQTKERQVLRVKLQLPTVVSAQLHDFPVNEEVTQKVAQMMLARSKEEAVRRLDRGDLDGVNELMSDMEAALPCAAPGEADTFAEDRQEIEELKQQLSDRDTAKFRKSANYQAYGMRSSRRQSNPE